MGGITCSKALAKANVRNVLNITNDLAIQLYTSVLFRGGESEAAASFTPIRNNLQLYITSRKARNASIGNRTIVMGMFVVIYVTKPQGGGLGKAVLFFQTFHHIRELMRHLVQNTKAVNATL
jgi:hypothetical protein